jgi:hypothetical protein
MTHGVTPIKSVTHCDTNVTLIVLGTKIMAEGTCSIRESRHQIFFLNKTLEGAVYTCPFLLMNCCTIP